MTWRQEAEAIIRDVHSRLPHDASLDERKAALKQARPSRFTCTSWGRKTWQRAQKEYLEMFGQKPRGWKQLPPTPLEDMIADAQ